MADAVVDNDVVLKGASYGFLANLLGAIQGGPYSHGILGSARFVLPKALRRRPPSRVEAAASELDNALATLETLEPTGEETILAAELEYEALRQALPLHGGECLLISMLSSRDLKHLLTGDRNAISALGKLILPASLDSAKLVGKFICFEQAVLHMALSRGASAVRNEICAERDVDTAMRVCFSCSSPDVGEASWLAGLESHIGQLRGVSGSLLIP